MRHVGGFQDAPWRGMVYLIQRGVTSVKDIDTAIGYGPACPER